VVTFSFRWRWLGLTMGVVRGWPVAAACALYFGAGGGIRRPAGLSGPKGRMGRLTAGPIGLKAKGNPFPN
jgi:hypothetical protein